MGILFVVFKAEENCLKPVAVVVVVVVVDVAVVDGLGDGGPLLSCLATTPCQECLGALAPGSGPLSRALTCGTPGRGGC